MHGAALYEDSNGAAGRCCDSLGGGAQRASRFWRPRARLPAAKDIERSAGVGFHIEAVAKADPRQPGAGASGTLRQLAGWSMRQTQTMFPSALNQRDSSTALEALAEACTTATPCCEVAQGARRRDLPPLADHSCLHATGRHTGTAKLECSTWCDAKAGVMTLVGPLAYRGTSAPVVALECDEASKAAAAAAAAPLHHKHCSTVPWLPSRPFSTSFLG